MWRYILTTVMTGILILGGSLVLGEELRSPGEALAPPLAQIEQKRPIPTFEQRLNLKPLSDKELGQITAAGVGPIVYMVPPWLFTSGLLQLHTVNNSRGLSIPTTINRGSSVQTTIIISR